MAGSALAAVALLGAGGFVSYVSWRSAQSLVHPAREDPDFDPSRLGIAFEEVAFRADDGPLLAAWWMPERAPGHNGTIVFLHGYGDSRNQSLQAAPFLLAAAYDVLALDFRAHGDSEGSHTTVGLDEAADVRAAIGYLRSRGDVDLSRLALMGWSMGAATAINAAPEIPEIRAVVSDSAFATLTNVASNSITAFTGLPRFPYGPLSVLFAGWIVGRDVGDNRPVDAIGRGPPVLLIQGGSDDIAHPDDDGRALAAAAPQGSALWVVPGAKHVQARDVAPAEYEERVLGFLELHLGT